MVHPAKQIYGVQFHPEVTHSEHGQRILENFVRRVCRSGSDWRPSSADTIDAIKADIRARVGPSKNVLFFVSGGVDSSVAYKLCADALGAGSRAWRVRRHRLHAEERIGRRDGGVREGRVQERAAARCVGGISRRGRHARRIPRSSASASAWRFSRSRTTCSSICRRANGCSGRARSIPTRSNRAARVNPRSSRRTTIACPSCCGGSRLAKSSSRSCSSTRTRCAKSGARSACRRGSSTSSRFLGPGWPCGSSAPTSRPRGPRTRSSAKSPRRST